VLDELGPHGLEAVVDGGACEWGLESTVVKVLSDHELEIVRLGSLTQERVREAVGGEVTLTRRAAGTGALDEAPGQLASHYAPRAGLAYFENASALARAVSAGEIDPSQCALLEVFASEESVSKLAWRDRLTLSPKNNDREAASKLFGALRELDSRAPARIVALAAPEAGLGAAINDRLRRASARRAND
jgi:L-threonylcarbamoyladenylate synthase